MRNWTFYSSDEIPTSTIGNPLALVWHMALVTFTKLHPNFIEANIFARPSFGDLTSINLWFGSATDQIQYRHIDGNNFTIEIFHGNSLSRINFQMGKSYRVLKDNGEESIVRLINDKIFKNLLYLIQFTWGAFRNC